MPTRSPYCSKITMRLRTSQPDKRADLGVHGPNTLTRLVQLYKAWGKPEEGQKWQKLLDEAGGGEAGGRRQDQPAPGCAASESGGEP